MPTAVAPPKQAAEPTREDPLLAELERLWDSPSPGSPARVREPVRRRLDVHRFLAKGIVVGWIAFLAAIVFAAPAADPSLATPAWVVAASAAIQIGIVGAALAATFAPGFALACSAFAGTLGVPIGIACRATEHHMGAWWLVETGAFAALAVASIACLATRRGR